MNYILGIDLGTSSLKGVVFDQNGNFIGAKSSSYDVCNPKKGYSEQNPKFWIDAFENVIEKLNRDFDLNENLIALSFSGQMHSLVLLDEQGRVLRDAILWNDVRTIDECKYIRNKFSDKLLEITNNIALEGFTLPKILWVKKYEAEIFEKTHHILLPKDYLRYYLTGKYNVDYSDAAGTLLLDIENHIWSEEIIRKFGINRKLLPPLVNSIDFVGYVKKDLILKYGFKKNVRVFAGCADNCASEIGSGVIGKDDTMLLSIGTSGVILNPEKKINRSYNGKLHFFNSIYKDTYYSMGVTLSAGQSLNWFRKSFSKKEKFEDLTKDIDKIKAGSDGLIFAPYLNGERSPYFDGNIRGSFIGLDISHTKKHLVKSTLEGITFSLRDNFEMMEKSIDSQIKNIISVGGGSKNKDWLQIQADIFNKNIMTINIEEGPGLGAAMIAALGMKYFYNVKECSDAFIKYTQIIKPNKENTRIYDKLFEQYKKIYPNTKSICYNLIGICENQNKSN